MEKKINVTQKLEIVHVLIIKVHKRFLYRIVPESVTIIMNEERVTNYRIF